MKTIGMIGHGAFGTAVATVLANNGFQVKMWCYEAEDVSEIKRTQENKKYLPGIKLNKNIEPTNSLQEVVHDTEWIFEAIPVQFLGSVLNLSKAFINENQKWVVLSKGIEQETLQFPTQMIDTAFNNKTVTCVCGGPSFAVELARKQPTGLIVTSSQEKIATELQKILANDYLYLSCSTDEIGVQVGGAIKNVVALGVGLLEGAGFGENTKTLLLTRSLNEIVGLADHLGAQEQTLYGLSGLGDLVLTAMGKKSRNLEVGRRLGSGQSLEQILKETGYIPEGINTLKSVFQLQKKLKIELPILTMMYRSIFENNSVDDLINILLLQ